MGSNDPDPGVIDYSGNRSPSYVLSGKIMLSAIIILFVVVILMICLHLYARWYLLRARQRYLRRRSRNRRPQMVFYVDPTSVSVHATRGLSASVVKSLPVFTFSAATHPDPIGCPVCLSELEDGEPGRILPNCKHTFHVDCIDMWFHSHSTCPLCRSPVEPIAAGRETPADVVIAIPGSGSSSELCDTYPDVSVEAGTSSSSPPSSSEERRMKPSAIEVPRRNITVFEEESTRSDSPSSRSIRSPMSRMLSLTRILSRERRTVPSPSAGAAVASPSACIAAVAESDIGQGRQRTQ